MREYPNIDAPVVSVRTVYPGATAEVMESQVTKPLEDSLSGIEGIRTIKSVSREEVSQITVEFVQSRDPDAAANDVRDRVARVRGALPNEAEDPVVGQDRSRRPGHHVAGIFQRPAKRPGNHRLRRPRGGRPAANAAGRGHGHHRRRSAATPCACGWTATAWPRYGLTVQDVEDALTKPEYRTAVGAHRKRRARVHRADRNRSAHAGRI